MRSDPLDVATAITIGRGTRRKMRQNLAWAIGYNAIAMPIAAGALQPLGITLSPAEAAVAMSGSSVIVALNAVALRRLHLPGQQAAATDERAPGQQLPAAPAGSPHRAGKPSRTRAGTASGLQSWHDLFSLAWPGLPGHGHRDADQLPHLLRMGAPSKPRRLTPWICRPHPRRACR